MTGLPSSRGMCSKVMKPLGPSGLVYHLLLYLGDRREEGREGRREGGREGGREGEKGEEREGERRKGGMHRSCISANVYLCLLQ